ncbi:MAG: hypothetical protein ACRDHY_07610 [Anaerolineales bacterium]
MEPIQLSQSVAGHRYDTATSMLLGDDAFWDGHSFERHGRNRFLFRTQLRGLYFALYRSLLPGEEDHIEPLTREAALALWEELPRRNVELAEAFPSALGPTLAMRLGHTVAGNGGATGPSLKANRAPPVAEREPDVPAEPPAPRTESGDPPVSQPDDPPGARLEPWLRALEFAAADYAEPPPPLVEVSPSTDVADTPPPLVEAPAVPGPAAGGNLWLDERGEWQLEGLVRHSTGRLRFHQGQLSITTTGLTGRLRKTRWTREEVVHVATIEFIAAQAEADGALTLEIVSNAPGVGPMRLTRCRPASTVRALLQSLERAHPEVAVRHLA